MICIFVRQIIRSDNKSKPTENPVSSISSFVDSGTNSDNDTTVLSDKKAKKKNEVKKLKGTYSYGTYSTFKFDGKGKGVMTVDQKSDYDFTYTVDGDRLEIIYDYGYTATYRFELNDNSLCIYGIENTTGVYQLDKTK